MLSAVHRDQFYAYCTGRCCQNLQRAGDLNLSLYFKTAGSFMQKSDSAAQR